MSSNRKTRWWKRPECIVLVIGIPLALAYAVLRFTVMGFYTIPTGSMAPCLRGDHVEIRCDRCKIEYSVGVPEDLASHTRRGTVPAAVPCPNCGAKNKLPEKLSAVHGSHIMTFQVSSRDRWSLIAHRGPMSLDQTYVHRVVGLPGETVELRDGDVFVNGRRAAKDFTTAPEMWIPVRDTRYKPSGSGVDARDWKPAATSTHWRDTEAGWTFESDGPGEESLDFAPGVTNELAYNALMQALSPARQHLPVSDVKIELRLGSFAGAGPIGFEWERGGRIVQAVVTAAGEASIASGESSSAGKLSGPLAAGLQLEFAFRDGRAYLASQEKPAVSMVVLPELLTDVDAEEAKGAGSVRLRIVAAGARLSISWITVSRDVHYGSELSARKGIGCKGNPITLGPHEYFVLGDNSESSADSRWWSQLDPSLKGKYQPGVMPEETIVGKVFVLVR